MPTNDNQASGQGNMPARPATIRESAAATRERAGAALDSAREKASSAYESARESAARATRRTAEGLEANPVAAIVGGIAVGALVAALLPRTQGEAQAFGKIGKKIADTAKDAAASARETGKAKLDELGLDRAREKLGALVGNGAKG